MKTFYRVAYRNLNHEVIRSANFYDRNMAQAIADDLNQQFNQLGTYFIESAPISELSAVQLNRLFTFGLITEQELVEYTSHPTAEQQEHQLGGQGPVSYENLSR